jgi:hypothetical protein
MSTDHIEAFLRESLLIEGIVRDPTQEEINGTVMFLSSPCSAETVCGIQAIYAPGKPLRDQLSMDVQVGNYTPPFGSPLMRRLLMAVLKDHSNPWICHVAFEALHPFMDGNGRTGRAVWAHKMITLGALPFALPFLHRFYYQTLSANKG